MSKIGEFVRKLVRKSSTSPQRYTDVYPQLYNVLSGGVIRDKRPVIKPTVASLRRFSNTTYARCAINTIKNPIAHMEWEIIPRPGIESNTEIERQINCVTTAFRRPNQDDSFGSLLSQIVEDYLVTGAGVIEQQLSKNPARPIWLYPVDATSIQLVPGWSDPDEPRYYQSMGFGGNIGGIMGTPLRNDELIYIRRDPSTASPFGVGSLEIAYTALNNLIATQEYAGNVASNSQPENVLFMKKLNRDSIEALKRYWRDEVEGQGVTPIISTEDGGEIAKLHGGGDGALYLQYQEMKIREIAAAFQISPQNMGLERDVNRSTAETSEDRDWVVAVVPTAQVIESHINRECIEGKLGLFQIMFRFIGLDRENATVTAQRYEIEYRNNCITPNEYRVRQRRPPLTNEIADKLYSELDIT